MHSRRGVRCIDHVGWNTLSVDGRWVPTFPNPRYLVPEVEFDYFEPQTASLSSWYTEGRRVLQWFGAQDRFNLIFAPHVMLFKRWLTSRRCIGARLRPGVPRRFLCHPNILIDTGSQRSIDMSYVRGADIYLGDVSSQIYEWIEKPRPVTARRTPSWAF